MRRDVSVERERETRMTDPCSVSMANVPVQHVYDCQRCQAFILHQKETQPAFKLGDIYNFLKGRGRPAIRTQLFQTNRSLPTFRQTAVKNDPLLILHFGHSPIQTNTYRERPSKKSFIPGIQTARHLPIQARPKRTFLHFQAFSRYQGRPPKTCTVEQTVIIHADSYQGRP